MATVDQRMQRKWLHRAELPSTPSHYPAHFPRELREIIDLAVTHGGVAPNRNRQKLIQWGFTEDYLCRMLVCGVYPLSPRGMGMALMAERDVRGSNKMARLRSFNRATRQAFGFRDIIISTEREVFAQWAIRNGVIVSSIKYTVLLPTTNGHRWFVATDKATATIYAGFYYPSAPIFILASVAEEDIPLVLLRWNAHLALKGD